jgi:DUF4097 and DUF4098 domain-containing protein YvlB
MRNPITPIMTLTVLTAGLLLAGEMQKTEEKTFPMSAGGSVTVMADEGEIVIQAWDKPEVFVTVTKKAWSRRSSRAEKIMEKIRVEMTLVGNALTVREPEDQRRKGSDLSELFHGEWFRDGEGYSVDYTLNVPKEVDIHAEADEGNVSCSGTSGSLRLFADEGEIVAESVDIRDGRIEADEGEIRLRAARCSGSLVVEADEGEIDLQDVRCSGSLTAEVDEGDIRIVDSRVENLTASADEGTVVLRNVQAKKFSIGADEGDVEADFTPEPSGSYTIETDEGEVLMWVPENASLKVDFETEDGRTDSDFHLSRRETDSGDMMRGRIGGGDGSLRVTAGEGDIALRKRGIQSSQHP